MMNSHSGGCACEPAGSDGLTCPDARGVPLCAGGQGQPGALCQEQHVCIERPLRMHPALGAPYAIDPRFPKAHYEHDLK